MVLSAAKLCKAGRARGSTLRSGGAFTPHFGRVYGMGIAADGVVVAARCLTLSGESLCLQGFAGGEQRWGEGCQGASRGASRGCAGTGMTHGRWALLCSAQGLFTLCRGRCGLALTAGGISIEIPE